MENVLKTVNDVINLNQMRSNLEIEKEKLEQLIKSYSFRILPPIQPLPKPTYWNC
jgi:hypothetical protein